MVVQCFAMSKVFKAKFKGECIVCPLPIQRGQRIYHDGGGFRHSDCEALAHSPAGRRQLAELAGFQRELNEAEARVRAAAGR